jgi:hypothetical protein
MAYQEGISSEWKLQDRTKTHGFYKSYSKMNYWVSEDARTNNKDAVATVSVGSVWTKMDRKKGLDTSFQPSKSWKWLCHGNMLWEDFLEDRISHFTANCYSYLCIVTKKWTGKQIEKRSARKLDDYLFHTFLLLKPKFQLFFHSSLFSNHKGMKICKGYRLAWDSLETISP